MGGVENITGEDQKVTSGAAKYPIRGPLHLAISTSNQKVCAGSDFSIFVVIQNPFDVPVTIYQVQTHIPVELIDINGIKIRESEIIRYSRAHWYLRLYDVFTKWLELRRMHTGVAIAVGTEFEPGSDKKALQK